MNQTAPSLTLVAPQRWKLWLWAIVLVLSGIGFFATDWLSHALGIHAGLVTVGAIGIGAFVLVGASLSIRCPSCGLSLAWYGLSKQAHHAWLSWLLNAEACPRCGFSHLSSQGNSHVR
jgi:hypothetical protein